MEVRNESVTTPTRRSDPAPARVRGGSLAGPRSRIRSRAGSGILGLLFWQAAAMGVVSAGIVLDRILRPAPGIELAVQAAALIAALFLCGRGLDRFVPDLDRRWRVRRRMF